MTDAGQVCRGQEPKEKHTAWVTAEGGGTEKKNKKNKQIWNMQADNS